MPVAVSAFRYPGHLALNFLAENKTRNILRSTFCHNFNFWTKHSIGKKSGINTPMKMQDLNQRIC